MLETRRTDRSFSVHLSAVGLANLADGIVQTGIPLIAITLTRSPLLIGMLTTWLLVVFAFAYGVTEVFTDLAAQAQVATRCSGRC